MIKAIAFLEKDRPLYLFGLTAENVERLQAGKPIFIQLEEMGSSGEVVIMYGKTQGDIVKQLGSLVGPSTIFRGFEDPPNGQPR